MRHVTRDADFGQQPAVDNEWDATLLEAGIEEGTIFIPQSMIDDRP
jgi:hypothetical protein